MIKSLAQQMPVIAYTQGSMASGSYYAGMYANTIYANRGALIGSIGVIFNGLNIKEMLDKIGIQEQGIKAGAYKEVGTSMRQWSEEERQFIENLIQEQYELFRKDVIEARGSKLKVVDYREFAEGKVFSAHKAAQLGIIDKVGSMQEAIEALKQSAGVDEAIWLKKDKFEAYMDKVLESTSTKILSFIAPKLKAEL